MSTSTNFLKTNNNSDNLLKLKIQYAVFKDVYDNEDINNYSILSYSSQFQLFMETKPERKKSLETSPNLDKLKKLSKNNKRVGRSSSVSSDNIKNSKFGKFGNLSKFAKLKHKSKDSFFNDNVWSKCIIFVGNSNIKFYNLNSDKKINCQCDKKGRSLSNVSDKSSFSLVKSLLNITKTINRHSSPENVVKKFKSFEENLNSCDCNFEFFKEELLALKFEHCDKFNFEIEYKDIPNQIKPTEQIKSSSISYSFTTSPLYEKIEESEPEPIFINAKNYKRPEMTILSTSLPSSTESQSKIEDKFNSNLSISTMPIYDSVRRNSTICIKLDSPDEYNSKCQVHSMKDFKGCSLAQKMKNGSSQSINFGNEIENFDEKMKNQFNILCFKDCVNNLVFYLKTENYETFEKLTQKLKTNLPQNKIKSSFFNKISSIQKHYSLEKQFPKAKFLNKVKLHEHQKRQHNSLGICSHHTKVKTQFNHYSLSSKPLVSTTSTSSYLVPSITSLSTQSSVFTSEKSFHFNNSPSNSSFSNQSISETFQEKCKKSHFQLSKIFDSSFSKNKCNFNKFEDFYEKKKVEKPIPPPRLPVRARQTNEYSYLARVVPRSREENLSNSSGVDYSTVDEMATRQVNREF